MPGTTWRGDPLEPTTSRIPAGRGRHGDDDLAGVVAPDELAARGGRRTAPWIAMLRGIVVEQAGDAQVGGVVLHRATIAPASPAPT
jgi:hypothetical protein